MRGVGLRVDAHALAGELAGRAGKRASGAAAGLADAAGAALSARPTVRRAALGVDAMPVTFEPAGRADAGAALTHMPAGAGDAATSAVRDVGLEVAADAPAGGQPSRAVGLAGAGRALVARVAHGRTAATMPRVVQVGADPGAQRGPARARALPAGAALPIGAPPPAAAAVVCVAPDVDAATPTSGAARTAVAGAHPVAADLTSRADHPAAAAVGRVGGGIDAAVRAAELQMLRAVASALRAELPPAARIAALAAVVGIAHEVYAAARARGKPGRAGGVAAHPVLAEPAVGAGGLAVAAVVGIVLKVHARIAAGVAAARTHAGAGDADLVGAARGAASATMPAVGANLHAPAGAERAPGGAAGHTNPVFAHLAVVALPRTIPAVGGVMVHRDAHPIASPLARVGAGELLGPGGAGRVRCASGEYRRAHEKEKEAKSHRTAGYHRASHGRSSGLGWQAKVGAARALADQKQPALMSTVTVSPSASVAPPEP